jgi:membrane associated rhomboid family serine protease
LASGLKASKNSGVPANTKSSFGRAVLLSSVFVGILFLVMGAEALLGLHWERFGIAPRTAHGLIGIIASPLLHGNMHHLLANSVPLFVLLVLLLSNAAYHPLDALSFIWIASGLVPG